MLKKTYFLFKSPYSYKLCYSDKERRPSDGLGTLCVRYISSLMEAKLSFRSTYNLQLHPITIFVPPDLPVLIMLLCIYILTTAPNRPCLLSLTCPHNLITQFKVHMGEDCVSLCVCTQCYRQSFTKNNLRWYEMEFSLVPCLCAIAHTPIY